MGRRASRRDSKGDTICIYRGECRSSGCADNAINGINITLLQCMGFRVGGLVVDRDGVGWEQEGSEPWSRFAFMAVIFIEHMLEVLVGSNRHQGIKILWDYLVLEDRVYIKHCSHLLH